MIIIALHIELIGTFLCRNNTLSVRQVNLDIMKPVKSQISFVVLKFDLVCKVQWPIDFMKGTIKMFE